MILLRHPDAFLRAQRPDRALALLGLRGALALLAVSGFFYGCTMGAYSLRPLQMLYSGLKVPLLLTVSSLVCLPNFFVVNTVLGLREDLGQVLRGILCTQLTIAIVLLSLAPFTALAYLSSGNYRFSVLWNGVMFLTASLVGQAQLTRFYQPLLERNRRHALAKRIWLTIYIIVTIQLAWMLRPFIGTPELETTFFRQGVWDNAFVVVVRAVWDFIIP